MREGRVKGWVLVLRERKIEIETGTPNKERKSMSSNLES